jgi:chromosome partitioning protein
VTGPVADGGAEYLGQIGPCMLLGAVAEAFPEAVEHSEDLAGAFVVQVVGGEALDRKQEAPIVISAQASRLDDVLTTSRAHGADLCIIDTAPHSETAALAAARAADLIVIPCRPAILDLRAISSSVDLVQIAKRPALIVLNAAPPRGGLAAQAEDALRAYGIPVAEARIGQRAAFVHSLTAGQTVTEYEPHGAAASEIRALCLLVCKQAGMITRNRDRLPV